MTYEMTPGRWRGLMATSSSAQIFQILAFDQRGSYRKMLPAGTAYEAAAGIKSEVVAALSSDISAVLLDPEYGMAAALVMPKTNGLLLSLEESGYSGDSTYRKIEFYTTWSVAKIKAAGASAVKLLAYYHPESGALAEEIEGVIARIITECRQHDLPLFLEPMSYSLKAEVSKDSAEFAATRPAVVAETARRLGALKPDVLKMEFPVDAAFNDNEAEWVAACEAVSSACDVPWVLLSAGVEFETFERQTRIACERGASGWLAGRAIWKECVAMDSDSRAQFLATTARQRVERLNELSAAARPWTQFYHTLPVSERWFEGYAV